MTTEKTLIPGKYLIKDASAIKEGSVEVTCKYCGGKFAVPPADITEALVNATCCDDPRCVEKMNAELTAGAIGDLKADANKAAADAISTALGK